MEVIGMSVNIHYKTVGSALKKGVFANPFSLGKYAVSPYMAREHGCIYCDGRAERYFVAGNFSKDIVVRKNLPDIVNRAFRAKGIPVGVLAMPLLPGITDTMDHMDRLYQALSDAGAAFDIPAGLTLRPGRQKDLFFKTLGAHFPQLVELYEYIFRENRRSGSPHARYIDELREKLGLFLEQVILDRKVFDPITLSLD